MSNEKARIFLEQAEFLCEPEPEWIEAGQRPDFFCTGACEFWCEVKTLDPPESIRLLGTAHDELHVRAGEIQGSGRGMAYVSETASSRDLKVGMELTRRAIQRLDNTDGPRRVVAVVPDRPKYNQFVRFSLRTEDSATVEIHSCESKTGKYSLPYGIFSNIGHQITALRFSSGAELTHFAHEVVDLADNYRFALSAWHDERPFALIATALRAWREDRGRQNGLGMQFRKPTASSRMP